MDLYVESVAKNLKFKKTVSKNLNFNIRGLIKLNCYRLSVNLYMNQKSLFLTSYK